MKKLLKETKAKEPKEPFIPDFNAYGTEFFYEGLKLLDNEKNKEKFIKSIERIIRTSLEYRGYIKYLKTEALLTHCVVMNKLPDEVASSLSIEMHHCPLTLYDLVDIVLQRYLLLEKPFTRISIANEVMDAHYMNQIGIVPMTVTLHQMIHNNCNLVNKNDIFGNYKAFAENYELYLTEDHRSKIEKVETLSDTFIASTRKNYLEVNPELYIERDDSDDDKVLLIDPELTSEFEEEIQYTEETEQEIEYEEIEAPLPKQNALNIKGKGNKPSKKAKLSDEIEEC